VRRESRSWWIPASFNEGSRPLTATLAELCEIRARPRRCRDLRRSSVEKTAALARAAGVYVIDLPFNSRIGGGAEERFRYADAPLRKGPSFRRAGSARSPRAGTLEAWARRGRESRDREAASAKKARSSTGRTDAPSSRSGAGGGRFNRLSRKRSSPTRSGFPRLRRRDCCNNRGRIPGRVHGLHRVIVLGVLAASSPV